MTPDAIRGCLGGIGSVVVVSVVVVVVVVGGSVVCCGPLFPAPAEASAIAAAKPTEAKAARSPITSAFPALTASV
jgi:hypothetical protein